MGLPRGREQVARGRSKLKRGWVGGGGCGGKKKKSTVENTTASAELQKSQQNQILLEDGTEITDSDRGWLKMGPIRLQDELRGGGPPHLEDIHQRRLFPSC